MATEVRFEPTLFAFLGTSSAQIGWRLKQLLGAAYGDVPVLRYLWIDTDSTLDPLTARYFSRMERAELSGFNGDDVLANLNMYPTIQNWWRRETRLKPGFIRRGANQVRLNGRLAFFRMFNDRTAGPALIDKLRYHIEALQQIDNYDATERMSTSQMRYIVERGSTRVVIFFSICGGSGSSISTDVAYVCRHLLETSNPTIMTVGLLPPVMDKAIKNETHTQREKIRANAYAWIKENEYLLSNPSWRVTYPEGGRISIQAPPYDLTFLVDLGNDAGDRLSSEDDIFSMVAQAVFLDTGSSIGGAMRGFNANVSVTLEEFRGRQRAYSSLAAASLVFPADKILKYTSARLGQAMIQDGLLAEPDAKEVSEASSALLGRLGLRDATVLEMLLADRQIPNANAPAIRKTTSVETIRNLLAAQESRDQQERAHQAKQIGQQAAVQFTRLQAGLRAETLALTAQRGVRFAQAVLECLAAEPAVYEMVAEETTSLPGLKARLAQRGVAENDLAQAQTELQAAKERLRSLEGELLHALLHTLMKKSWEKELDRARNDCLSWLNEINQRSLQLAGQREAANLYDQVIEQLRSLLAELAGVAQTARRAAEALEGIAQDALRPAGLEQGIYELSLEAVDGRYIQDYYRKRAGAIDAAAAYRDFTGAQDLRALETLDGWNEYTLAKLLEQHGRGYFAAELENTSLLHALTAYYQEQAPQIIESLFDRLVRYCHPFWQYNRDSGIQGQEGKSLIGVEDEHSELIPARFRNDLQFEIKSTGFKHRIDVARVQHGLPAFLLRGMADYKACYDARRKGLDPLHVLPEAALSAEVAPEERQEARQLFVLACAFGLVVQIGSWYCFDPQKEYTLRRIRPGRDNRLGQGYENAEETFTQRDDFVRQADQLVEDTISNMGNPKAIALLEEQIEARKRAMANMSPENGLRRQYEREIGVMAEKQRMLSDSRRAGGLADAKAERPEAAGRGGRRSKVADPAAI